MAITGLTGAPIHIGSAGLPDIGLSEWLAGKVGAADKSNLLVNTPTGGNALQVNALGQQNYNQPTSYVIPRTTSTPTLKTKTTNTLSGGGGGTITQATPSGGQSYPTDQQNDQAQSANDALLSSLNTQYDYLAEQLRGQQGELDTQQQSALSATDEAYGKAENQVKTTKEKDAANIQKQISAAGNTAKSVQDKNRNILRALGILSSSYGGEQLAAPMTEFASQRADLLEAGRVRGTELDNYLQEKMSEHARAVSDIKGQYATLVGNIQRDLRFNERQRADAIQSANAALQSRLGEIQNSAIQWNNTIEQQKQQLNLQLAQLAAYNAPAYNQYQILSNQMNPATVATPKQAGIYGTEQQKKNTLSSIV